MQNRAHLMEIHSAIIDVLRGASNNAAISIDKLNDDNKNNVMWALEKFSSSVPTTAKYPWLKPVDGLGNLHPRWFEFNQQRWDEALEWYDTYKSGAITFLEYRIKIRKKELEEHIKMFENCKAEQKPDHLDKKNN